MVVVCGEGLRREIALCLVPRIPSRSGPYVSVQSQNSNSQFQLSTSDLTLTSLLREAEVYAAHNQRREATYI